MPPQDLISRPPGSPAAELSNSQSFLSQLRRLPEVNQPHPTVQDQRENNRVFEKAVTFNNNASTTSAGRVDLYRQGCFGLESKQGTGAFVRWWWLGPTDTQCSRHPRGGGDPASGAGWRARWIPAFAGMTNFTTQEPGDHQ